MKDYKYDVYLAHKKMNDNPLSEKKAKEVAAKLINEGYYPANVTIQLCWDKKEVLLLTKASSDELLYEMGKRGLVSFCSDAQGIASTSINYPVGKLEKILSQKKIDHNKEMSCV